MKHFIVHNSSGEILRTGTCSDDQDFFKQCKENEFVLEGAANDITQKIINGKAENKTFEEIEADKTPPPEPIPYEQQIANITNKQLQEILDRISELEL